MEVSEVSFDICGLSFLCIFGSHINGDFCSIINWGVSAEVSFDDFGYSSDAVYHALLRSDSKALLPRATSSRIKIANELTKNIIFYYFHC